VARRRPLQAAAPTQLSALRLSLDQLLADLRLVKDPVDDLCRLIAAVKKPLTLPATLETNLTDLRTLLQVVNTVASSASWLPAPAGPAAKAVTTGLKLFLGPPKPGALTEMINTARAVDEALEPARKTIGKDRAAGQQGGRRTRQGRHHARGAGRDDGSTDRTSRRESACRDRGGARLNGVLAPIAQAIETLKREVAVGVQASPTRFARCCRRCRRSPAPSRRCRQRSAS
jgi:hypothetical protein